MTRLVLLVVEAARLFCFNATNIIYGKACSKYNKKCLLYIIGFLLAYILLVVHLDPSSDVCIGLIPSKQKKFYEPSVKYLGADIGTLLVKLYTTF